jgi:BTB/POZ domain-containing adapter for CUL3-mediated RhoA degradation protein
MLRAMFSGKLEVLTDAEGWILLDRFVFDQARKRKKDLSKSCSRCRCGKHFGTILNFLRDGSTPLPDTVKGLAELLAEAKYYCIEELAESCERALESKKKELNPICKVPLITSATEENYLISTSTKPVVKLLINRHNNKYSYTNTSDDNLLKNIELFDKLSLRFSGNFFLTVSV